MKKLLSAILALTMVVGSVAAMDVTESAENPALSYVVEAGIMQGYEDGLFYAEDDAEYAQVVQTLYNHAGQPAVTC
ncbi:MAG: S-layer homology domain-containing protein, partial [Eubacteriales bacterium]